MTNATPARPPIPTPTPSPCTSVCRMAAQQPWCEGCFRTLDEITAWATLSDSAKQAVWALLPQRRQASSEQAGEQTS